jgi:hypothetical protein
MLDVELDAMDVAGDAARARGSDCEGCFANHRCDIPPVTMIKSPTRRNVKNKLAVISELEPRVFLSGAPLYVTNYGLGTGSTVGEYTTTGQTVNPSLITIHNAPLDVQLVGSDLYVSNNNDTTGTVGTGSIGEYTASGTAINSALITSLPSPDGFVVSGSDIFVTNTENTAGGIGGPGTTISEFTTSGTLVNGALVSGLSAPDDMVLAGSDIYVASYNTGIIGEYTTSGATVNADLISGINGSASMVINGSDLFVTDSTAGTVGEYDATTGAAINPSLISGLSTPVGIALYGSDLYVSTDGNQQPGSGVIGQYTLSGTPINANLITGLNDPSQIAISSDVASQLAFAQQPVSSTTTGTLAPVTVDVEDSSGTVFNSDDSTVSLSLSGATGGATLAGTTTMAAVNGVVTFTGLSIASAGQNYTLTATDGALTPATSSAFNVVEPSTLVPTLAKVMLPATAVTAGKLNASVPVTITNQGASVKGNITVNIYADTATNLDGNQVLLGTLTKKNATLKAGKTLAFKFSVKSLPATLAAGTYHLLAEVVDPSGLTNQVATTQTIQVAAPFVQPVVSVAAVVPSTLTQKKSATVTVTITNTGNIAGSGVTISLSPSSDGVTPISGTVLATLRTSAKIQPGKSAKYKLRFKGSALALGNYFPYVTVTLGTASATEIGTSAFSIG